MRPLPKVVLFEAQAPEVSAYAKRLLFRGYRVLLIASGITDDLKELSKDIRIQIRLNPSGGGIDNMGWWAECVYY
jgi:hypothetical protein